MDMYRYLLNGCGWLVEPGNPQKGMCGLSAFAVWRDANDPQAGLKIVCLKHDAIVQASLREEYPNLGGE